jgi:glycosyltransferase involved in cell wall biosynthesis
MKIAVIVPITSGVYVDDTSLFCDGLTKYFGHEIIKLPLVINGDKIITRDKDINLDVVKDVDLIWAPYEPLIPIANWLRSVYNKPVVGHFEVLPPLRIAFDEIDWWWSMHEDAPNKESVKVSYYNLYKYYANEFDKCDIKTSSDLSSFYRIEKLLGRKVTGVIEYKPYPMDTETLRRYEDPNIEEKYQIISVMRLVSHKRHNHIIKALSLLENPPLYVIIGDGIEKNRLKKLAEDLNVRVEFKGILGDEDKCKAIQESMFAVYPWAWLPAGDAAFYKKPVIVYDAPDTRDRLKNMPLYVEENNIGQLATTIKYLCENANRRVELGIRANEEVMNNRTGIYNTELAVTKLNTILIKAIK